MKTTVKKAKASVISCPVMVDEKWIEQPENTRKITIWEDFDKDGIMNDFYKTLQRYKSDPNDYLTMIMKLLERALKI